MALIVRSQIKEVLKGYNVAGDVAEALDKKADLTIPDPADLAPGKFL